MVRILYRNIALFLVTARTPFAVACSQTCFEPGGSLDPNALDDPELFLSRAYQNCMLNPYYLRGLSLTVLKLSSWEITSTSMGVSADTRRMRAQLSYPVCLPPDGQLN